MWTCLLEEGGGEYRGLFFGNTHNFNPQLYFPYDKWQIDNGLMVWTENIDKLIFYVDEAFRVKLKPVTTSLRNMWIDIDFIVDDILEG